MYMRSYFCEEEMFPNDLSRVNKVSNSLSECSGPLLLTRIDLHMKFIFFTKHLLTEPIEDWWFTDNLSYNLVSTPTNLNTSYFNM